MSSDKMNSNGFEWDPKLESTINGTKKMLKVESLLTPDIPKC